MKRIVVDVMTGQQTSVDLTPQEVKEVNDRQALPPPVPSVVTMRQARLALLSAGLLSQVDDAVNALKGAEGDAARVEWEYSGAVQRDWPLVATLSTSLGVTDGQMNDLFRLAATL